MKYALMGLVVSLMTTTAAHAINVSYGQELAEEAFIAETNAMAQQDALLDAHFAALEANSGYYMNVFVHAMQTIGKDANEYIVDGIVDFDAVMHMSLQDILALVNEINASLNNQPEEEFVDPYPDSEKKQEEEIEDESNPAPVR